MSSTSLAQLDHEPRGAALGGALQALEEGSKIEHGSSNDGNTAGFKAAVQFLRAYQNLLQSDTPSIVKDRLLWPGV